ncbi:MAG: hypothetical protein HYY84_12060 [Deltaproteobacteria bacterium]|nr:hypothetical protein [Deltaproteobacteria bacterium]
MKTRKYGLTFAVLAGLLPRCGAEGDGAGDVDEATSSLSWVTDYAVSVTGRCVTKDGTPISGAAVEVRDQDFGISVSLDIVGPIALDVSGNDICATGTSKSDGTFSLSGRCGDPGFSFDSSTKPDLYVRCALEGEAGRIFSPDAPWTLYNATSTIRSNNSAAYNVGDVKVATGAGKAFNSLKYTVDKLSSLIGEGLTPVWVVYPGGRDAVIENTGATYFASYAGAVFMSLAAGDETNGTVAHEYGHTLQFQAIMDDWSTLQSLVAAWNAGVESLSFATGGGHTYKTVSNPVMAFAEGWAEFIEEVVYGSGAPNCSTWTEIGADEDEKIQVEGNIACRLWRLYEKWGFGDIWTAMTKSKAVRYDDFVAEYKKLHASADSVAVPSTSTKTGTTTKTVTSTSKIKATVAAVGSLVNTAVKPSATAAGFASKAGLSSAVGATIAIAEGPACTAIRDAYQSQASTVTASCAKMASGSAKTSCESTASALTARATALATFCATLSSSTSSP